MHDASFVPTDADRRAVSTMLDFHQLQRQSWQPQELADILLHQLSAPLFLSLGTLSGEVTHQLRQSQPALDPLLTLNQLLHLPQPPVELLRLVKRFAKNCRSDPDNPLPAEIVMLLYYASIAVAQTRTDQSISDLPASALHRGLRWVSNQVWVDEQMRDLLRETLTRLDAQDALHFSKSDAAAE